METRIKKFLEFNGKAIFFLNKDGQYWVAIRPICEALEVQFSRTLKNIKSDEILGQLWSKQTMTGADNKQYLMVSLPEKYIYGWLFSIRSNSQPFLEYKLKCYNILYEYFHGAIAARHFHLSEKSEIEEQISILKNNLNDNNDYLMLQELIAKEMRIGKTLKQLDVDLMNTQLKLFE